MRMSFNPRFKHCRSLHSLALMQRALHSLALMQPALAAAYREVFARDREEARPWVRVRVKVRVQAKP